MEWIIKSYNVWEFKKIHSSTSELSLWTPWTYVDLEDNEISGYLDIQYSATVVAPHSESHGFTYGPKEEFAGYLEDIHINSVNFYDENNKEIKLPSTYLQDYYDAIKLSVEENFDYNKYIKDNSEY